MLRVRAMLTAVMILAAAPAWPALPEAEAVMARVSKVFADLRDLAADVQIQTPARQASGTIVLQYIRKTGDAGDAEKTVRKYVVVTRRKVKGEGPVPGGLGSDWRNELKQLRGKYAFTTMGAGKTYGEPVVFLEGRLKPTPETDAPADALAVTWPQRVTLAVSSQDYFPRRVALFFAAAKDQPATMIAVTLTDVKLNKGLKPDAFAYRVPPGAEVKDVE